MLQILIIPLLSLLYFSEIFALEKAVTYVDPLENYTYEQILEKYQKVTSALKSNLNGPVDDCSSFCGDSCGEKKQNRDCSFANFCKSIAKNIDGPYLYISKDGGKIPNYQLYDNERSAADCFDQITSRLEERKNTPANKEKLRTKMSAVQKAHIALKEKVIKSKIIEAVAKFDIENIKLNYDYNGIAMEDEHLSKEDIEKKFQEISKKANVKLPKWYQEEYVGLVLAMQSEAPQDPSPLGQSPFQNPKFATSINLAGSETKLRENQEKLRREIKRSENIFQETQQSILIFLDKQIAAHPNDKSSYLEMKKRIETSRLSNPLSEANQESCNSGPNAYYLFFEHSVILCHQLLELPSAALKEIIAHELGHSIDPCFISNPLVHVTNAKEKDESSSDQSDPLQSENKKYSDSYSTNFLGQTPSTLSEKFSTYTTEEYSGPVYFKDNPAYSVIDCLTSDGSIKARTSDKVMAKKDLDKLIDMRERAGANDSNSKLYNDLITARNNFDDFYSKHGGCHFLPGNNQVQESWSDWIASQVIGMEINSLSPDKKMDFAFESLSVGIERACSYLPITQNSEIDAFKKEMGCTDDRSIAHVTFSSIVSANEMVQNVHPFAPDRAEKIFLAHPEIKKALGCNGSSNAKYCDPINNMGNNYYGK